jgi:hypothetical protein
LEGDLAEGELGLGEAFFELGVVVAGPGAWPVVVPVLVPGFAAPEVATLITWAGGTGAFEAEALERPISTPTPIESSNTPTPAITAVVLPDRGCSPLGGIPAGAATVPGASGGCFEAIRACRSPDTPPT